MRADEIRALSPGDLVLLRNARTKSGGRGPADSHRMQEDLLVCRVLSIGWTIENSAFTPRRTMTHEGREYQVAGQSSQHVKNATNLLLVADRHLRPGEDAWRYFNDERTTVAVRGRDVESVWTEEMDQQALDVRKSSERTRRMQADARARRDQEDLMRHREALDYLGAVLPEGVPQGYSPNHPAVEPRISAVALAHIVRQVMENPDHVEEVK